MSATGKFVLLIPFVKWHGHFSVDGDNIRMEVPKLEPIEGTFEIDGDVLRLPGKTEGESRYERY